MPSVDVLSRPSTDPGRGSWDHELVFLKTGLVSWLVSPPDLALLADLTDLVCNAWATRICDR